jgi:hypothetical protein
MTRRCAGSSRRSHTKSRKGCRTCKQRHIRCDEGFPQWSVAYPSTSCPDLWHIISHNCTKHKVRCDYLEKTGSEIRIQNEESEQACSKLTFDWESQVQLWQSTGNPLNPGLNAFSLSLTYEYSVTDLWLLHHLSSTCDDLRLSNSDNLTLWTHELPKWVNRGEADINHIWVHTMSAEHWQIAFSEL